MTRIKTTLSPSVNILPTLGYLDTQGKSKNKEKTLPQDLDLQTEIRQIQITRCRQHLQTLGPNVDIIYRLGSLGKDKEHPKPETLNLKT